MASMKKIAGVIAAIKTIYPYYAKDGDVKVLTQTWAVLLKDYPDQVVDFALQKCLQICKMPPTPADMIEQINVIQTANETSEEELWAMFTRVLRDTSKYVYRINFPLYGEDPRQKIDELWCSLPGEIQRYLGSKSELMRLSRSFTDEDLQFEKSRFLKSMPTMRKREEYQKFALLITDDESKLRIEGELK